MYVVLKVEKPFSDISTKRVSNIKKWNRPPAGETARDPPVSSKIHRVMIPWLTPHPEPVSAPWAKKQDEKPQRLHVTALMAKRKSPFSFLQHISQSYTYMLAWNNVLFFFLEKIFLKPTQTVTPRGCESSENGTVPGWEDAASSASSSEWCVNSQSQQGQLLFHKPLACMQLHLMQEFPS